MKRENRNNMSNENLRNLIFVDCEATGKNPFGHSARRIGDFYAGLVGDFTDASSWKKLRVTVHDHNPVHDAMGNLEAFERILSGER